MSATLAETIEAFRVAMIAAGVDASEEPIVADGRLHRFHVPGDKPHSENGWYVLHADATPVGKFGSWRTGDEGVWTAKRLGRVTPAERARSAAEIATRQHQREFDRNARQEGAAVRACYLWDTSPPAGQHVYLIDKGIGAHGLRQRDGRLLVPLRDAAGVLWNLQFIGAGGGKRFLFGARCAGLFHMVGLVAEEPDVLCLAEGYATAASVHESSGHPCAVAFSAGNLAAVALALRARYPASRIVVCADDDAGTAARIGRNPGMDAAHAAAEAVGGTVAYPPTDDARQERSGRMEASA